MCTVTEGECGRKEGKKEGRKEGNKEGQKGVRNRRKERKEGGGKERRKEGRNVCTYEVGGVCAEVVQHLEWTKDIPL